MAPRSRGSALLFDTLLKPSRSQHICLSCRNTILRARYASTAAYQAQATVEAPPISQVSPDEPGTSVDTQPRVRVKAGIVVSRPPLITPDPHPFETAFHLYQRRLNERLVLPFSQYFHYKRGTPAFEHWRTKRRERGGVAARDVGKYNAYTKESWNDEVLMGDDCAHPQKLMEKLIEEEGRGAEFAAEGDEAAGKLGGLKRTTAADGTNDQTNLERRLDRTLYLLVRDQSKTGDATAWRFPSGTVEGREGLKDAAQRVLDSSCGVNMHTWIVAGHPIGHCVEVPSNGNQKRPREQEDANESSTEATYFMKARIFAGQADLKDNSYGLEDFKWLSKEEIEKHVTPDYWTSVKNMLVEQ